MAFCGDPNNSFDNIYTEANFGSPNSCTPATVTSTNLYIGEQQGALPFNAVAHNSLFQPVLNRSVGNSLYNALQLKVRAV